jgi:hypothetical protein
MCTNPTSNLQGLANAAAEGDRQALERFATQALEIALNLAEIKLQRNKICRWIDPCDVAQIVTLKACRIAQTPERNSAILHWPALIRQMTLRTITDLARSLKHELGMIHSQAIISLEASSKGDDRGSIEAFETREHNRAMIRRIRSKLPCELRPIWYLRAQGRSWTTIAKIQGGHPQTLRIRFNTAVEKISLKEIERIGS